jgi:hypothetical protein
MMSENGDLRVYLDGHPHITGTVVVGDEWCDVVTVQWDEGRTTRVFTDRLVRSPAPVRYLVRGDARG